MNEEKIIYFHTEYSNLQRFLDCANSMKVLNPNVSLTQSRLILETLINSIVEGNGNLNSRISELENFGVDYDIIDAMHQVRLLGNIGAHDQMAFWKDADKTLKNLFKVMLWYGSSNQNQDLLADVQFCLAQCYCEGIGVEPDTDKQVFWLKKSAENGSPFAQRDLGICYCTGQYVVADFKKAVNYLNQAVSQNLSDAEFYLGYFYLGDHGEFKRDTKLAHELLIRAESKGNLLAEYVLAECFNRFMAEWSSIPKDPEKVFQRYSHIIETGLDNTIYQNLVTQVLVKLGDCYQYGLGTAKNLSKCFECYLKASKRGNVSAYYKVAECYEKGVGVKIDAQKAEENYSIAALMGHQGAHAKVNSLTYLKHKNRFKGGF
ncbi:MAG: SEL1-like repeat protein [Selenomonadaceae bacterium]|nr:SEL1-like repeat protein [Selenomonadaceae bacterium]